MSHISLKVRPTFFLVAGLLGFLSAGDLLGTLIWVVIIFVSVLFHEFGHALAALMFGRQPHIELVAFGGVTYHDGSHLSWGKQFLIVLNGPFFGFLLYLASAALLKVPAFSQGLLFPILSLMKGVNLFWTVLNLLPVLPLDGGQLLRLILEACLGSRGVKYALGTSLAVAFLISGYFFFAQSFLIGALFFLLGFQSFDALRKVWNLSAEDTSDTFKDLFISAENKLKEGKKEEALSLFETLKEKTHEGILHIGAIQYLAFLYEEKGEDEKSYSLLAPIENDLEDNAKCLLHKVAFSKRDFPLVIKLAGPCFQSFPFPEVALRSACAHAALGEVEPAVGWLKTLQELGVSNLRDLLQAKEFDPIRSSSLFLEFCSHATEGK